MKLDPVIVLEDGTILEEICPNDHGIYLIHRVPAVKRGFRGKSKGKVDELLIVGVPWSKAESFLAKYGLKVKIL